MTFSDQLGVATAFVMLLFLAGLLLYALVVSIIPWFVALFHTMRQYFPINYRIYLHNRNEMSRPKYSTHSLHNYKEFWTIHADCLREWRDYSVLQHILAYYHRRNHPEDYV